MAATPPAPVVVESIVVHVVPSLDVWIWSPAAASRPGHLGLLAPLVERTCYGKLTTSLGVVLDGVTAPVLLMTWVIVPTPPSETVSRSCHATPAVEGDSNALYELTAGLTLK